MAKKATKKTTKPQAKKPAKPVTPTKGKGKNVTPKGKCAPKAKPAKPTKKTDKPVKATKATKNTPKGKTVSKPQATKPKTPKITKPTQRTVKVAGDTYHAKGKQMYEIPAQSTLKRLKNQGVKRIMWGNGDTLVIKD